MWSGGWLPWGWGETAGSLGNGHTTGGWKRRRNSPCMLTCWHSAHTEDWDSGSSFPAHIGLIWISVSKWTQLLSSWRFEFALYSIQLKFLFTQISLQNQFHSWRKRSYRLDILPSRTIFSIFWFNMNIILFSSLIIQYTNMLMPNQCKTHRISPYFNHSGENTWVRELPRLLISPGSTHSTLLNWIIKKLKYTI